LPTPRKPTKLKELQGTLQPCRTNRFEPVPVGVLGDPPQHLGTEEKRAWLDISESIAPGVATSADMLWVEIVSKLMADFRRGVISSSGMSALMRGLSQLGMSPADRSKIVVKKDEENGRFDRFK
jgi:hypothetical protein